MNSIAYLNGEFSPLAETKVSCLDRGFIYGDGVYEVIPIYQRKAFELKAHLDRLSASLAMARIGNPYDREQWTNIIEQLVEKNEGEDQALYMQVTRGVAPRKHQFPSNTPPTIFMMTNAFEYENKPVAHNAVTHDDFRWQNCNIKTTSLLGNVMLSQIAADADAIEVILHRGEEVTEASASNVFIVKNGIVYTPPNSNLILPGISKDVLIKIAEDNNIPIEQRTVLLDELMNADEVWISSSTKEVAPITKINSSTVANGKIGPVSLKMFELFQQYKAAY